MKFFTRERYLALQVHALPPEDVDPDDVQQADAMWNAGEQDYQRLIDECFFSFPEGAQKFIDMSSMHDAVIESTEELPKEKTVTIVVVYPPRNGHRGARYPGTRYTITFHGTSIVEGLEGIVGDAWLYQEMHPSDTSAFELHVLCIKGEFRVAANDMNVSTESFGESAQPRPS